MPASTDNNDWLTKSPASKFGAIIGEVFEKQVIKLIRNYLEEAYNDYEVVEPEEGRTIVRLEMSGGLQRQMDNVIALKHSNDPVALFETKWLKDARHHNDKGAWILQLREVRKKHATIRGAAAVLAGYWTSGVGVMLMNEGGIEMVWVATDQQVYDTLQEPLDDLLKENTFTLNAPSMRSSYPRPADLLRLVLNLRQEGKLDQIAQSWLQFEREDETSGEKLTGEKLVKRAMDKLLSPLPSEPKINKVEIALQIESGNTIYESFSDFEEAREFLENYYQNPQAILDKITPKRNLELDVDETSE